jgi:hypothetical protein
LDPTAESAFYLWLLNAMGPISKIDDEHLLEFGWLLGNIHASLSPEARRKVGATVSAVAHAAYPHEVPVDAVASPRTLDALRTDTHLDIEPLIGASPWESVEGLRELVAIFDAQAPHLSRVVDEQVESAFPMPPNQTYFDMLEEDWQEFDNQKVRQSIYNFRRNFRRYIHQLGHSTVEDFYGWLDANRAEVAAILQGCGNAIRELIRDKLGEQHKQHAEHVEPISSRQMERTYQRGCFAQETLRIKFYCFLRAKSVTVPRSADNFLYVRGSLKRLLKDASK